MQDVVEGQDTALRAGNLRVEGSGENFHELPFQISPKAYAVDNSLIPTAMQKFVEAHEIPVSHWSTGSAPSRMSVDAEIDHLTPFHFSASVCTSSSRS